MRSRNMINWVIRHCWLLSFSVALAPPHPDAEPVVHDHHRRLRGDSEFHQGRSGLTHAELCDGLSQRECDTLDQEFAKKARKLSLETQSTGFAKVAVLCIRFTDHSDRSLPSREEFDILYNGEGTDDVFAPTGSIRSYMAYNSNGKIEVQFDVMPCIETDNTEHHYSFGRSGITRLFGLSANPVLTELERLGLDMTEYDRDGDGELDATILMHSGYAAEVGNHDCVTGNSYTNRIWSHAILNPSNPWTSETTGIRLGPYMVTSGLRGTCGGDIRRLGVPAHEFLHLFGLPDTNDNSGEWIGHGLGYFSVMSDPFGVNVQGLYPGSIMPFEKMELGWLEPTEITADGTYSIGPVAQTGQVYIIRTHLPGEYFLIENRQPTSFDQLLWNGGILIWHIDEAADAMKYRGFPGQDEWPANGNHYKMALMAPDGRYDLEEGRQFGGNPGDGGDFWRGEGMELGPGPTEAWATPDGVYPNTNTYQLGMVQQTGIRIYNFSPSGTIMTFSVSGMSQPSVPIPTPMPTPMPIIVLPPISARPTPSPTLIQTPFPTLQLPTFDSTSTETKPPIGNKPSIGLPADEIIPTAEPPTRTSAASINATLYPVVMIVTLLWCL